MPLTVQAAESESSADVPSLGTSETAPSDAAQRTDNGVPPVTESAATSENSHRYARSSPFDFGAQSYQPGFAGCASTDFSYASSGSGGISTALGQPAAPAQHAGRFTQLSLSATETYTDNLNLAPEDRAISDYITEISPRLDACADSGRVRGTLSYQLQGLFYAHNSQYNHVYNNIAGDTTVELLPGRLYLGADTSYGQSVVDPALGYSRSNALRPGNQTSVWTSNISPYYFQPLGLLGTSTWRYRYGKTIYGDSNVPDSTLNGAYFNLASPNRFDTWSWQANAFTQRVRRSGGDQQGFFRRVGDPADSTPDNFVFVENDNSRTTYFDKATLQLGYQLTQSLKLLALGGLEDEYQDDGTNDRLSSPLWNVGFRWNSATNSLEVRVGHRFFGTSYFARAAHRGRVFDASVDYREEPSTQSLNSLNSNGISNNTSFQQPTTSLFDRGVFVEKRASASVGFHTALTQTTLTAYRQKRDYVASGPDDRFTGGDIQIDYQFRPRTSIVPRAGWQRQDSRSGFQTDTSEAGLSLIRVLAPTLRGSLSYGHAWRNSNNSARDYDENRVSVQVLKSF